MVVTAIVGLYMLGFTIMDPSTEAALLKLGTWTPLLGVLGILAVQGLCSVAIIRFFLTEARDGFHPVKTLIAPILGALAMAGACYLLIANRGVLSGAGDACSSSSSRSSCWRSSSPAWCWRCPALVGATAYAKWDASRERRFPHEHCSTHRPSCTRSSR